MNNRYQIIQFWDICRKDLIKKYGAKNYFNYGSINTTTEQLIGSYENKEQAIEKAKKEYEENEEKYTDNGYELYLLRYSIIDTEEEDTLETFGIDLEEIEKNI